MRITEVQDGGRDHDGNELPRHGTAADASEQDPVSAMHDTTEEAGEEAGLADTYRMDLRSAHELGVALDRLDELQPDLT